MGSPSDPLLPNGPTGSPDREGELLADLLSLGGAGLLATELASAAPVLPRRPSLVQLGLHRRGPRPTADLDAFDILLTAEAGAPRPWVFVPEHRLDETAEALSRKVATHPVAAAAAVQVLRMTLCVSFVDALTLESMAYSMVLASRDFRRWRAACPRRTRPIDQQPRVRVEMDGDALTLRLDRPSARNAFDAAMRDELTEALEFALDHPDCPAVVVSASGPDFSAGGDLDEFGQASDVGEAHLIRTLRSPAARLNALGERATVILHGRCIGAGVEVPAAAATVAARRGTTFRLPELAMGLIPGAGGTATISRRIGRQRCAFMTLSGEVIDLATALSWGLADERI